MIMMLQEKYEARMQVIAQDLEQAQSMADQLKYMLDERESYLHGELQNKQMNNQMISKCQRERQRETERRGQRERQRERENHSWIFWSLKLKAILFYNERDWKSYMYVMIIEEFFNFIHVHLSYFLCKQLI